MFFGASLMCGYSAIKSFSSSFSILKEDLINTILNDKKIKDQPHESDISAWKHRLEKAKVSKLSKSQEYAAPSGKVNSESDFEGILVKKDKIEFDSEIVEKVYEFLPSEQKYIVDEVGNVLGLDPIGVVRTALEIMEYQLDPDWYAWGTEAPRAVDKVKVSENIRWNEVKDFFFSTEYNSKYNNIDNAQKIKIQNRILGLPINAKTNQRIQRFNELDVNQWYENCHKEIMSRIKLELSRDHPNWKKYLKTLSITTFITKDGFIKHIIAPQGKTTSYYSSKITEWIQQKYGSDDIIIAETPAINERNFIAPDLFRSRENHAEVKTFEELVNQMIAKNSKIYLSADRRMCITCKIVGEQFKILSQIEGIDVTIEVYRGEDQESTSLEKWEEDDEWHFKNIYREFFDDLINRYPTLEIDTEEQLDRLWRIYGYKNPLERVLNGIFKI